MNNTDPDNWFGHSCAVNANMEHIEISLYGKEFVFQGNVISKDNDVDFEKIKNSFVEQKGNGNLVPDNPTILELRFLDVVPQAITWCDIYIRDGNIVCPSLSKPQSVDEISAKTILPVGVNAVAALDSDMNADPAYKIIRFVCEYNDQTVEYVVFFE